MPNDVISMTCVQWFLMIKGGCFLPSFTTNSTMLTLLSSVVSRAVPRAAPRALSAYFGTAVPEVTTETGKWPPYNVCSLPFNIKPNPDHIKLKETHKR